MKPWLLIARRILTVAVYHADPRAFVAAEGRPASISYYGTLKRARRAA